MEKTFGRTRANTWSICTEKKGTNDRTNKNHYTHKRNNTVLSVNIQHKHLIMAMLASQNAVWRCDSEITRRSSALRGPCRCIKALVSGCCGESDIEREKREKCSNDSFSKFLHKIKSCKTQSKVHSNS